MVDLGKDRTTVALRGAPAVVLVLACVLAGGVVGALLDPVAGWTAAQGWLPFQGVLDQVHRFAGWAPVWGQLLAGAALGAGAGVLLVGQATAVEVDGREVVLVQGGKRRRFARSQVGEAVVEGRTLSLRDPDDVDLVRETVDGDLDTLRAALRTHGWPVRG